jgi:hypothetical protein
VFGFRRVGAGVGNGPGNERESVVRVVQFIQNSEREATQTQGTYHPTPYLLHGSALPILPFALIIHPLSLSLTNQFGSGGTLDEEGGEA